MDTNHLIVNRVLRVQSRVQSASGLTDWKRTG